MADAHANFAASLVATAPSPATSGTSLVVTAADGAKFPAVPFNATIWPAGAQPTTANAEIVRVTARSTDTLTITRAQEGSSARTVIVGDQIAATITAKTLTDVETVAAAAYTPGGTKVAVADGGTNAGTAAAALTNLGVPYILLSTTTLGSVGTFDVSSGLTGYTTLKVILNVRGSDAGSSDILLMRFNNDSGNNYYWQRVVMFSSTMTASQGAATASAQVGVIPAGGGTANGFSALELTITDYSSGHLKRVNSNFTYYSETATTPAAGQWSGLWNASHSLSRSCPRATASSQPERQAPARADMTA